MKTGHLKSLFHGSKNKKQKQNVEKETNLWTLTNRAIHALWVSQKEKREKKGTEGLSEEITDTNLRNLKTCRFKKLNDP